MKFNGNELKNKMESFQISYKSSSEYLDWVIIFGALQRIDNGFDNGVMGMIWNVGRVMPRLYGTAKSESH